MNNLLIAYDMEELEKKKVLSEAENLYKSKLLNEEQRQKIRDEFVSKLYTPSIFMRMLLFIFSLIGMISIVGPIALMMENAEESAYQIMSLLLGISLLFFTEWILIKKKSHYNSGITEAGIYSGLSFIAIGLLISDPDSMLVYLTVGLILSVFAAIRYLNLLALVLTIGFLSWILLEIMTEIGGMVQSLMPFIFMAIFGFMYFSCIKLQAKLKNVIFDNQLVILKTMALILFYIAGNYFVVRESSIKLMELSLSEHEDIPFAFVFYIFTAIVPIGYIYRGISKKSILLIRVGLLTITLSAVTFKYYFSLGHPVLTITLAGALLIVVALFFFNYLKQVRAGYTRELLLCDKWNSQDLTAIIASQTLGGNKMNSPSGDKVVFKGGKFGGAGAGGNW
jgi:hypothetical protein